MPTLPFSAQALAKRVRFENSATCNNMSHGHWRTGSTGFARIAVCIERRIAQQSTHTLKCWCVRPTANSHTHYIQYLRRKRKTRIMNVKNIQNLKKLCKPKFG